MKNSPQFALLGLGRFGMSILETLADFDVSVLACDKSPERLHMATEFATHVIQADISDEAALDGIGLGNFEVVIIAAASDFEATLIATMRAKEEGAGKVVVKANSMRQKTIIESVGGDLVVLPERESGAKTARKLMQPNLLDIFEDSANHTITEMRPPKDWVGRSIKELDVRNQYGVTILAVLRDGGTIIPVPAGHVVRESDLLITLGAASAI